MHILGPYWCLYVVLHGTNMEKSGNKLVLLIPKKRITPKQGCTNFQKKKSSSCVKILGDRMVARSKRYKGGPQILGVQPGNCAALDYETNVNYRLQNNCSFKVAL